MRPLKVFLPLPLLISCSVSQCSTTPQAGPIAPPIQPYTPSQDDNGYYRITFSAKDNIVQFNPDKFESCGALDVVYDGTDYGILLVTEDLYLPADNVGDKHMIEVKCLSDSGEEIDVTTLSVVHTPQ